VNRPAALAGSLPSPLQALRGLGNRIPSKKRSARIVAILTVVLVVLAAIAIYSPLAHPRNLEVNGITGSSASEIRDALQVAGKSQSTFAVSESDLMKSVAEYPEVAGVKIHAHPPFRLDLDVIMRPPVARVQIGGRTFVVAGDGTVLQRAGATAVPKIDATIAGVELHETRVTGGTGALRILAAAPEPLLDLARTIRAGHSGLEIEMKRGPRLIFGNSTDAADKWAAAATVLASGPATRATYIDLRVPARPAVGGLGGSREAGASDPPTLTALTPNTEATLDEPAGTATAQTAPTATNGTVAGASGTGTGTTAASGTGTSAATGTAGTGATGATQTGTPTAGTATPSAGAGTATDAAGTAASGTTQTATPSTGGAAVGGGVSP
jgi:cell division septal protein FtsQ